MALHTKVGGVVGEAVGAWADGGVSEAIGIEVIGDDMVDIKYLPRIIETRLFYDKALHCKST